MSLPAMVLGAGRGERMQPLTADRAKPALPLLGRPIIARVLRELAAQGVDSFAVNTHHAPESLRRACAAADLPAGALELFHEPRLMGTGGALLAPRRRLASGPCFVLHNGDTLLHPPLATLVAAALREGFIGSLLVARRPLAGYSALQRDGERILGLAPKDAPNATQVTYLGVSVWRRELLDAIPGEGPSALFDDLVWPLLAKGRHLAAVPYDFRWDEFTSPASYRTRALQMLHRAHDLPGGSEAVVRRLGVPVFLAEGAELHPGARAMGPLVIERDVRVARGALVGSALLMEGSSVAAGAYLTRAIVMPSVAVPARATLRDGIVVASSDGAVQLLPFSKDGDA